MLIEIIVIVFVVGFVAIAAFGHVLVAQALLAPKDSEEPATQRKNDAIRGTAAETWPAS